MSRKRGRVILSPTHSTHCATDYSICCPGPLTFVTLVLQILVALCDEPRHAGLLLGQSASSSPSSNFTRGPPVVNDETNGTVFVLPRGNVDLVCPIQSNPSPLYEWFRGNPMSSTPERITEHWERFETSTPGTLKIRSVIHEDSGTYICKAVNGFGSQSFTIQLAVTGEDPFKDNYLKWSQMRQRQVNETLSLNGAKIPSPPEILLSHLRKEKEIEVAKGSQIQLKCEAKGYPKPNVTWFKDNKEIQASKDNVALLKLTNVSQSDNGVYRCESLNIYGKSVYEVIVRVAGGSWQELIEIVEISPRNMTLVPGSHGVVTCSARVVSKEGFEPLLVWLKRIGNESNAHSGNVWTTTWTPSPSSLFPLSEKSDPKAFFLDGSAYKVLRGFEVKDRARHIYSTELSLNNVSASDAGTYCCIVAGFMGYNRSSWVWVSVLNSSKFGTDGTNQMQSRRDKDAQVQWTLLSVFGFVTVIVLIIFAWSRGCPCSLVSSALKGTKDALTTPNHQSNNSQHQNNSSHLLSSSTSNRASKDKVSCPLVPVSESMSTFTFTSGSSNPNRLLPSESSFEHAGNSRVCDLSQDPSSSLLSYQTACSCSSMSSGSVQCCSQCCAGTSSRGQQRNRYEHAPTPASVFTNRTYYYEGSGSGHTKPRRYHFPHSSSSNDQSPHSSSSSTDSLYYSSSRHFVHSEGTQMSYPTSVSFNGSQSVSSNQEYRIQLPMEHYYTSEDAGNKAKSSCHTHKYRFGPYGRKLHFSRPRHQRQTQWERHPPSSCSSGYPSAGHGASQNVCLLHNNPHLENF